MPPLPDLEDLTSPTALLRPALTRKGDTEKTIKKMSVAEALTATEVRTAAGFYRATKYLFFSLIVSPIFKTLATGPSLAQKR